MTKKEILLIAIEYFNGDELAADVWADKYALKNQGGDILEMTPDDMHNRLAVELGRIEAKYPNAMSSSEIYDLIKDFKYIVPQGSPMYGIGNNHTLTSLSNCFVVGNNEKSDSYGSIMRTDEEQVQLMKRRGGVGHDISHYRPSGSVANNTVLGGLAGTTLFMNRFSNSTREVAQDGRRGALMLSIDVRHPDTEKFIDAKLEEGKVTGANISVKLTNKFMEAVKVDGDFYQTFPIDYDISAYTHRDDMPYDVLEEHGFYDGPFDMDPKMDVVYIKKIKAKKVWDKIIQNAWKSAEPGIFFWDKIISESPADTYGDDWKTLTTNPCGEIPLCAYDSCRLLVINLFSYVNYPFTNDAYFDYELFKTHTRQAQRLMDDIVDLEIEKIDAILSKINNDPESEDLKKVERELWEKIRAKAIDGRRTGLGITGEGDMLAALNLQYGSDDGIFISEKVHKIMAVESYSASIDMAKERGAFPIWDATRELNSEFIKRIVKELSPEYVKKLDQYGRRNISNLTIAPTGTTSMMTQTSSGIEPLFMPWYTRRRKTDHKERCVFVDEVGDMWEEHKVFHKNFKLWLSITHPTETDLTTELNDEELQELFKESPYYGATANDVDWKQSVKLQGAVQKWIDHSISKTINLPEDATVEIVDELYMTAFEHGCKGATVYREGSRSGVLLSEKNEQEINEDFKPIDALKRPREVVSDLYFPTIKGEKYLVLVGLVNNYPYEVFAYKLGDISISENIKQLITKKRKSGWYDLYTIDGELIIENLSSVFEAPDEEDRTRLISGWLRTGGNIKYIVDILNKSKGDLTTFSKVIARQLKRYVDDGETSSEKCPRCSDNLVFAEGCLRCNCGYSKCG